MAVHPTASSPDLHGAADDRHEDHRCAPPASATAGRPAAPSSASPYTFNYGTLTTPAPRIPAGTYTSSVTVALTAESAGATIRYTTSTTPDPAGRSHRVQSPIYTAPLEFTATTMLKAKAFHPDYSRAACSRATYTIVVATPTLTPGGGTYAGGAGDHGRDRHAGRDDLPTR